MSWKSVADLLVPPGEGEVALIGAPMEAGSVTPGRCDLAPAAVRRALRRLSTYNVGDGSEISVPVAELGDVAVAGRMPADGFAPIRTAVAQAVAAHDLTLLLGGNNAVTRPAVHGLGLPLERVGLITLDAHFDLRETDQGPRNGNPVRCLLEDGLPGRNICQIGLAPYANTAEMHRIAREAGIGVFTIRDTVDAGVAATIAEVLRRLGHVDAIAVDFDIDVIDRSQCPGAPGARPGGMAADMFFSFAAALAGLPQVKLVDLTEFDPSLDVSDITALTAGRWVCEVLAGYASRRG